MASEIEATAEEIKNMKQNMQEAGEVRAEENGDYKKVVRDAQGSIAVLNKALEILTKVFEKGSFLQQPKFGEYKQSSGGSTVLKMIREIVADAEKELGLAMADEKHAQETYDKLASEILGSIEAAENQKTTLQGDKAQCDTDIEDTKATLGLPGKPGKRQERFSLVTKLQALKSDCDFLFKNFDQRQTHMTTEIEALNEAAAFLKGMK